MKLFFDAKISGGFCMSAMSTTTDDDRRRRVGVGVDDNWRPRVALFESLSTRKTFLNGKFEEETSLKLFLISAFLEEKFKLAK